jgi:hypothetical protein
VAVPVDGMGTASVAPVKVPPVPGVQKPPRRVGKRIPGPSRGGAGDEGEETSRSENETHLVAAGPPEGEETSRSEN